MHGNHRLHKIEDLLEGSLINTDLNLELGQSRPILDRGIMIS
jgi:hypothetical protein